jgi:hypothetical protein
MEPQKLVITGARDQARNTRSFDLRAYKAIEFTPGQVAILRVEGEDPAYFAFGSAREAEGRREQRHLRHVYW